MRHDPIRLGNRALVSRVALLDRLLRLTALLPLPALHGVGSVLGGLAVLIPNNARHIARVNAELCFADWPLARRKALVRCVLRESAKTLLELGPLWYRPVGRVLRLIRGIDGAEVMNNALAERRGLLIIAPHLGAWELLQTWVAQQTSLHALYRPPRQPALEPLITRARSRSGARFWPARASGLRALLKALRNNEAVGILPDQQPADEGVFVPFFGVPAKTMTLFGKLAARSRAPVVIGWAERLPRGRGYRLHWRRLGADIYDQEPQRSAAALNAAIEAAAREHPCQYQWTYRRFSRRPPGERNPYRRYASRRGWIA